MLTKPCTSGLAHGPHEWYWKNILRSNCPGLVVAWCGRDVTHPPHWHGEYRDELCYGSGLAGRCKHGEQMLNECDGCAADQAASDTATSALGKPDA